MFSNSNSNGYVYLLQADGTNNFKIGYSVNPIQRKKAIESNSPIPLNLIKSYQSETAYQDEQKLHKMFAHRRLHGEWFTFESVSHAEELLNEFFRMKTIKDIVNAGNLVEHKYNPDLLNHDYNKILNFIEDENHRLSLRRNSILIAILKDQAIIKTVTKNIIPDNGTSFKKLEKAFMDYLGYPIKLNLSPFTKQEIEIINEYKNNIDDINRVLSIFG